MSNVFNLPNQENRDEAAGRWISKINRGLTKAEQADYQAWIASDEENAEVMMSLSALWDDMEDLSRLADIFPEEGLSEARVGFSKKTFSMAASLLVVLGLAVFMGQSFFQSGFEKTYETSIGEQSTVSLSDGSELVLNTNSFVTVEYDDDHRLVTLLRGEIHIDVAHDELRPLSVKAGNRVVQAVGTAFNIELLEDQKFELIVTDGEVRVGDLDKFEKVLANASSNQARRSKDSSERINSILLSEQALSISEGQKIRIGGSKRLAMHVANVAQVAKEDISIELSWRQGNLVFNGESLAMVIDEIGRYTSTEFQFESDDIKDVRIAGTFKAGDIAGLLIALDDTFNVSSRKINSNRFSLYRDM